MKDRVRDMYEQITMPESCIQKVNRAMDAGSQPEKHCTRHVGRTLTAIAAVLALVLLISPQARAAVNGLMVKYFWPDSDLTIYEETNENGEVVKIVGVDTEAPAFARLVNGRLYFLGNGEKVDITDLITEEKPYYYRYVDEYDLTHYMAVAYSDTIENFGIYEFIKDENQGEWVTGTGRNYLHPETMERYPWVDIVWDEWDIPWPMPE